MADTIAVCTSRGGGGHDEGEAAGRDEERLEKQNLQEARGAGGSPGSEGLGRGEGSGCPGGVMGEGLSVLAEPGGFHSSTGSCQAHARTV